METIKLTQDFREFLKLLNAAKIEYMLIGGYAVALHGVVRPTKDMDLWFAVRDDNLTRLIDVLERFGFRKGAITPDMFTGEKEIFRMGVPPNRLELFTSIPGVNFAACHTRAVPLDLDGICVPVIALQDLLQNKRASARPQDLSDIAKLTNRT